MIRATRGFTIVELAVVITVIAILAAITVVAYNGVQQRARDSRRKSDFSLIQKALELYHGDMHAYPNCSGGPNTAASYGTCGVSTIASLLAPNYISSVPQDPINNTTNGSYIYYYGFGYHKDPNSCALDTTYRDNYIIGVKLETMTGGVCSGYWGRTDLNYILGSNNQ